MGSLEHSHSLTPLSLPRLTDPLYPSNSSDLTVFQALSQALFLEASPLYTHQIFITIPLKNKIQIQKA